MIYYWRDVVKKNIELVVSESIKRGKWIDISYINNLGETTFYWIAIKDIDLKRKLLFASIFNDQKSLDSLEATIPLLLKNANTNLSC